VHTRDILKAQAKSTVLIAVIIVVRTKPLNGMVDTLKIVSDTPIGSWFLKIANNG
jgi:hypothetical protein